jgi:hypothetical protein
MIARAAEITIACDRKSVFALRPSDPEVRSLYPEHWAFESAAKAELFTARVTNDVTTELPGHIERTAFQRRLMVNRDAARSCARADSRNC